MNKIKDILSGAFTGQEIEVKGWVRTFRSNRFIALNDGSCLSNLQIVIDFETMAPEELKKITTGASLVAKGKIVESQGKGQTVEMRWRFAGL